MTDEIYETPSTTPNFQTELAAQLADLIPEAIADGKVDVEKLKELLDDDVADGSERFGLFWPGKKRALRAAQEPTTATLKPDFENSKNWDTTQNVFIEGDNLEVLKILQKHYHAKIKMIYIDPPYNTGRDFVYPDNYKEGLDTYLEWTRQVNDEGKKVRTNAETEGRYHSNWLNMMYPRLKLARNLLADDGVIFISIDDNEQANLRRLGDEVFGEDNFVGQFKWNRVAKAPSLSKTIRIKYEYVLCYKRRTAPSFFGKEGYNSQAPVWHNPNKQQELLFPAGSIQIPHTFEQGLTSEKYQVELLDALVEEGGVNKYPARIRACSAWGQSKIDQYVAAGNLFQFKKSIGTLYASLTQDGTSFIAPSDLISKDEAGVENNTVASAQLEALGIPFTNPKPVSLITYLLKMVTHADADALVLDFFAGSATTGHAVMQLNAEDGGKRACIQVQLPEPVEAQSEASRAGFHNIAEISRKRLDIAGKSIQSEVYTKLGRGGMSLDVGFRSYKLSDTNFAKWRLSSDVEKDALQQHLLSLRDSATDDASADDLLTEILLKQGYSLTEAVSPAEVGGLDVRLVRDRDGDIAVLAYLNEHVKPTLEQLRALVDESPTRIIVLEDAFQGDDELKTNLAQLCKSKGIELWTA